MTDFGRDKYLFIINPASGSGISDGKVELIKKFMSDTKADYQIQYTQRRGDAGDFARDGAEKGFTRVISVGGDGTSSEVVNSIEGRDVIFTTIPCGSANDFSKTVGIPVEFEAALKNVVNGKVKTVDVGKFEDRCFINGLGIGLDGAVAHRFKTLRFLGGFFGYLVGVVIEALSFSGFRVEVNAGDKVYKGRFLLVGASNGPTQGGIRLAPEATITDGLLDVHLVRDMNLIKRFSTLSKVLSAKHTGLCGVSIIKADRIKLTVDKDIPAHMDGEPFSIKKGTHNISIIKEGLKVLSSG